MYDNEYYGAPNDYRNYLSHHGIKGQKWGVMHGPPYPLGSHTSAMIKKGKKVAAKAKKTYDKKIKPKVNDLAKKGSDFYEKNMPEEGKQAINKAAKKTKEVYEVNKEMVKKGISNYKSNYDSTKNDLKAKSVLSGKEDVTWEEKKAKYNRRKDIANELKQEDWKESMVSDDDRLIFYKNEKSKDSRELVLTMFMDNDSNCKSTVSKLKKDLSSITADSQRIHKDFVKSVSEDERGASDLQDMIKAFNSPKSEIHYDVSEYANKYKYSMTMWYDDFGFVKYLNYDKKNKRWNIDDMVSVEYV